MNNKNDILFAIKNLTYEDQVELLYDYCFYISENSEVSNEMNRVVNSLKPSSENKSPQVNYLKTLTRTAKALTFPR